MGGRGDLRAGRGRRPCRRAGHDHRGRAPGRTFRGSVTFIYPQLDEKTRTLTARVAVDNGDGALRPGMYATAALATAGRRRVSVRLEAVLPTGAKDLVFVNCGAGRFLAR